MKIFESVPIKNIQKQIKLCLKDEVEYREGQVVSKTLAQNRNVSLTLFAFEKGEEISTHSSGGDALVTVLDGKGTDLPLTGRFIIFARAKALLCREMFRMPCTVSSVSKCCLR